MIRKNKERVVFCWSGGKDSAYALWQLLADDRYEVTMLLSTFNSHHKRLTMHGVPEQLIQAQADSIGLPLIKVFVEGTSNHEYELKMAEVLTGLKKEGLTSIAFGDIFLEDLRAYREAQNSKLGFRSIFPIWKINTKTFFSDFLKTGFRTITCCVNANLLGASFCGRIIDEKFVNDLPKEVDACGENGEYHSFCFDGPIFDHPIHFNKGEALCRPLEIKTKDNEEQVGFWYCDLSPG